MDRLTDTKGASLDAMKQLATQMRQSAQAAIVDAYRLSLEGRGEGPSNASLQVFARLAAYELRLDKRIAAGEVHTLGAPEGRPPAREAMRQLPAPLLLERASEKDITRPAAGEPRAAFPLAALASFGLLAVCVAVTSWMVAGAGTAASAARAALAQRAPAAHVVTPETFLVRQQPATALAASPPEIRPARKSQSASVRAEGTARAVSARPATVVAACGALNFLSRAICMNNACAQPGMIHARVCADAVRQRRIDEARRNPTLIG